MALERPHFDYQEESHSERLARKSKESPFMVIVPSDRPGDGGGRTHRRNDIHALQEPFQ
ncbi:unnamed protein product [Leptidea sinapis]|uniref:Uncharacterized protein n=1 Tax=Leptidea sinapis TaxID=189913 RepID=A0A5E4QKY5_9NEOP|nr:unnamed protein product [Leptidea sinapis]